MKFAIIDLESTSREPEQAHIVEFAVVLPPADGPLFGAAECVSQLVRPPICIPAETCAVHHITDADVIGAPTWDESKGALAALVAGAVCVAHNAEYERTILTRLAPEEFANARWLCTYKAALRVWPDAPGHSNEVLRYFLGLRTGTREEQRPHSALHDAQVTALILAELLKLATLDDMLAWTNEPALLPTCPLGKFRGAPWPDVDIGFLEWILFKATDMREDVRFCARKEIDRRRSERAAA